MQHDPKLLKRIALASFRPCPELKPSRLYVENAGGKVSSTGGACPQVPFHVETKGFVYYDPRTNTTFGRAYPTEHAARFSSNYHSGRAVVRFLRQLRQMTPAEIHSQRAFYIKDVAPARKLPGFAA